MTDQTLVISAPAMLLVKNQTGFLATLREAADAGNRDLLIDFGDTELVDSSGMKMLVGFRQHLVRDLGGRLRLRGLNQDLLGLFRATRLDLVFELMEPWQDVSAASAAEPVLAGAPA